MLEVESEALVTVATAAQACWRSSLFRIMNEEILYSKKMILYRRRKYKKIKRLILYSCRQTVTPDTVKQREKNFTPMLTFA